jgi:hypothetical protein
MPASCPLLLATEGCADALDAIRQAQAVLTSGTSSWDLPSEDMKIQVGGIEGMLQHLLYNIPCRNLGLGFIFRSDGRTTVRTGASSSVASEYISVSV